MIVRTYVAISVGHNKPAKLLSWVLVGMLYVCCSTLLGTSAQAQQSVNSVAKDVMQRFSGLSNGSGGSDTTTPRPKNEDSIDVRYRTWRETTLRGLDSNVLEFNPDIQEFPLYVNLGNILTATKPVYFDIDKTINFRTNNTPYQKYFWYPENIPFFQEDKPFTKLGYATGGTEEQHFFARHSRNFGKQWNIAAGFRLTSSEGKYKNQKTNISNGFVNSNFVSKNERLRVQGAWTSNQADIQENGGLNFSTSEDMSQALEDHSYNNRYFVPVRLGQDAPSKRNVYVDFVNTGRILVEQKIEGRISYDFGRTSKQVSYQKVALDAITKKMIATINDTTRDSISAILHKIGIQMGDVFDSSGKKINDSVQASMTLISFTPKVRISLGYQYGSIDHLFKDEYYDSAYYGAIGYNNLSLRRFATQFDDETQTNVTGIAIRDIIRWHKATAGALYFLKNGKTKDYLYTYSSFAQYSVTAKQSFQDYDWSVGSKAKIGLWKDNIRADISGELTLAGWHAGDNFIDGRFEMYVPSLQSKLSFGLYQSFRSAAFHFTEASNFYLQSNTSASWEKEYTLYPFVALEFDFLKTKIQLNNFLFNNFFYFDNPSIPKQFKGVVNINQISMHNHIHFLKHFNYTSDLWFQNSSQDAFPVPMWITQQRIFVAGKVMGKQDLAMGIEALIVPSFKQQGFAPIVSDWIYQSVDTKTTTYTMNFFVHFRLRGLFFYLRFQNLNTASMEYKNGAFSYPEVNNASFFLGNYYPGFNIKFGFYWNLIN